jgi:hypothetical protein
MEPVSVKISVNVRSVTQEQTVHLIVVAMGIALARKGSANAMNARSIQEASFVMNALKAPTAMERADLCLTMASATLASTFVTEIVMSAGHTITLWIR